MFLTNRGTPEYYFPYTQIRAVAHIYTSTEYSGGDLPVVLVGLKQKHEL